MKRFKFIEFVAFFFIVAISIYILVKWAIFPERSWDAIGMWDARAKYLFYNGNLAYLTTGGPHLDYPILVSLNLEFFYSIMMSYNYLGEIIFPFYYYMLILLVFVNLRKFKLRRSYAFLLTALLSLNVTLVIYANTGYADIPLTFYYLIGTLFLFNFFQTKENINLIYAGNFNGFASFVKDEGLGLFVINIIMLLIFISYNFLKDKVTGRDFKQIARQLISFIGLGYAFYLPWQIILWENSLSNEYIGNISVIFNLQQDWGNLEIILSSFTGFHQFHLLDYYYYSDFRKFNRI